MTPVFNMRFALVTGGDRGIGRAIALRLSSQNIFTIISYRKREDEAKSTLDLIKSRNGKGDMIKADISNKEDVEKMADYIRDKYGGIDILVNNAGVGFSSKFADLTYDSWFKQIQTNLTGSFYVTKLLIDNMMNKKWGRIIFISSIAGIYGAEYLTAYSAAKAGLIGLAKSLAIEMAKYNITVNVVAPGFIETKLGKSYFEWLDSIGYKDSEKNYLSFIPSNRLASEDEVSSLVSFLASEEASGITGQVITVDAGASLTPGSVYKRE